jgi:uncharacterized membrane protein YhaH (DUF805 family)
MSFAEAVRSVLTKYVTFSGRARRSEYWWFVLAYSIAAIISAVVDAAIGTGSEFGNYGLVGGLLALVLLLPTLAVGCRRLHDTDRSGWWQLLGIIPVVGAIILIVWFCGDSKPDNRFGPDPKADRR